MSETETRKGKIKLFPRNEGESQNDYINRYFTEKGKKPSDESEMVESFYDAFYREAVMLGDDIWEVVENKNLEYSDIFQMSKNADGTMDFLVQFYNGSCGFGEALGIAHEQNIAKKG